MYDKGLLNILYSQSRGRSGLLYETIDYLKKERVLNSNELKLCKACIGELETFARCDLKKVLSDDTNIDDIEEYDYSVIDSKIDEFIENRRNKELADMASSMTTDNMYSVDNLDLFLRGYNDRIKSKIDNSIFDDLESLDIFCTHTKEIDISSACKEIDRFCFGLKRGSITTIIGDDGYFKSMWALNIAYSAISNGKNVMYLTLGVDKETIVKRLLARHSNQAEKFEQALSIEDLQNDKNSNLRNRIMLDFQENYAYRLVLFDINDLVVPSTRSLRRLILETHSHFLKKNDSGIDLIVIDDMSYLPLYNGKTTITSRNTVISEYYKSLKEISKNLFGNSCCILCTHKDRDNGTTATKNNGNYKLDFIPEQMPFWSDDILTIYGSDTKTKTQARLKVIKTMYGDVMDRETSVQIDYPKWFLSYDNETFASMKYLLKMEEYKNKELQKDIKRLISERDSKVELLEEYKKHETVYSDGIPTDGLGIDFVESDDNYLATHSDDADIQDKFDDDDPMIQSLGKVDK